MSLDIIEIIDRSSQGVTRPFLCRGQDNQLYFVKGRYAGTKALIAEWIAGHIGRCFKLPIPDFRLARIPKRLISMSARDDASDLGEGVGFASLVVPNACELSYLEMCQLPEFFKARTLLFDWWIANGDRTLNENGGNPNILWVQRDRKPHVIDHNLAFEEQGCAEFWATHAFASQKASWDADYIHANEQLMESVLADIPVWWREMPESWTEVNTGLTLESVTTLLWRFRANPRSFWRTE